MPISRYCQHICRLTAFSFQLVIILTLSFISDCINFKAVTFLCIFNAVKLDHSLSSSKRQYIIII